MTGSGNGKALREIDPQKCRNCSLSRLCLPVGLKPDDVEALERIIQRERPLERNEVLFDSGAPFEAIYAVRTGAMKSKTLSEDGQEQITGFHLPGEILGLDGIHGGHHPSTAVALETTSVCQMPFETLDDLAERIPALFRQLLRLMSQELHSESEMLQALARRSAEERLAMLLLGLRARFVRRGLSATNIRLPMSRQDLGNYLGLTPETLSRLFRRFSERGIIEADGREVRLKDVPTLRELSGNPTPEGVRPRWRTLQRQPNAAGAGVQ